MRKKTTEEAIKELIEARGNEYDYSLVEYKAYNKKITILCKEHGPFEQYFNNHLNHGSGCPSCNTENLRNKFALSHKEIINKFKGVHGDRFDYSKVEYKNYQEKVTIICDLHGEFKQAPAIHLNGGACPKCSNENLSFKFKYSEEEAIKKLRETHGEKYEYLDFNGTQKRLRIICPIHGEFLQFYQHHRKGSGCPKCSYEKTGNLNRDSQEKVISDFIETHGDKYIYDEVEYIDSTKKVKIKCKEHGEFWQLPCHHKKGVGCPSCSESKGEKETSKILDRHGFSYIKQFKFDDCKYKQNLIFDFYVEEKFLIEYDGEQHYYPVDRFGGKDSFKIQKERDKSKNDWCNKKEIPLLRIPYWEFDNIENKILEFVKRIQKKD